MKLSIKTARAVAEEVGARQVVIIAFDTVGRYGVASYGATKAECAAIRPLCNRIADDLHSGALNFGVTKRQGD